MRHTNQIVVDACLICDSLIGELDRRERARRFLRDLNNAHIALLAPHLFSGESDTAIRQAIYRQGLLEINLPAIYATLDKIPVRIILNETESHSIRLRAREIAAMLGQPSVYDSTYAALAELRGCDFWTADKRFANAANQQRHGPDGASIPAFPFVKFIDDYR